MKQIASLILAAVVICGCGGGGSRDLATRNALVTAGKGYYAYSLGDYTAALGLLNRLHGTPGSPPVVNAVENHPRGGTSWEFDARYGLYHKAVLVDDTHARVDFSRSDTNPIVCGTIDSAIESPDPFTYSAVIHLNEGIAPTNGWARHTLRNGHPLIESEVTMTIPNVVSTIRLEVTPVAIDGTVDSIVNGVPVAIRSFEYSGTNHLAVATVNGKTVHIVDQQNVNVELRATGSDGEWVLTWDAEYRAVLTGPNGYVRSVSHISKL